MLGESERIYVYYVKLDPEEYITLFNGLNVPADFDNNAVTSDGKEVSQMDMFKDLTIDIYVDAIQAEGFDTDKAAFEALEAAHPLAERTK